MSLLEKYPIISLFNGTSIKQRSTTEDEEYTPNFKGKKRSKTQATRVSKAHKAQEVNSCLASAADEWSPPATPANRPPPPYNKTVKFELLT